MSNATLSFLPWVRQGAASAITILDADQTTPIASVAAQLALNGSAVPSVAVALRGPSDVIGLDANQIVRTDPRPGTGDFEPNCFPSIEFDRPDFPWLFTPARASASDQRLRPWLCLVVVRKQDGVSLDSTVGSPLPKLTVAAPATPAAELPDLTDSWAWAHAQVAADASTQAAIDTAFGSGGPELTLSRLVCPRFLEADTEYVACVVPTFEVGRRTGLGDPVSPTSEPQSWNLAPAWSLSPTPPASVELPVYYHWEFRTGQTGDFEAIARGLTASAPPGLGKRTIDISDPGFDASAATTLELEGALLPITAAPPPADPLPAAFTTTLAAIINQPGQTAAADAAADPLLAPPMYGRWHAGQAVVDPAGATWVDELNLDPRWRVAAALGTRVVQEHQEALMASAWEQAAELQAANQRLRQLQLSREVGTVLHERHVSVLPDEKLVRVGAPAFSRLPSATGSGSMLADQSASMLPVGATRVAMRRLGRQRGPLTRRITSTGFTRSPDATWVVRLNEAAPPPPPAPPAPDVAWIPATTFSGLIHRPITGDDPQYSRYGLFLVAPEGAAIVPTGPEVTQLGTEAPDFFRSAARVHMDRGFPFRAQPENPPPAFVNFRTTLLDATHPRVALSSFVGAIVTAGDRVLAPTASGVPPTGVETIMAAPHFPHPMYEALRDLSLDLLVPGVDRVAPESVVGLRTNRRFIEAYMVGLNHEMGRELLWRGYPTDQRGTYFDHFWGSGVPNAAPVDITELHTWSVPDPVTKKVRGLGDTQGAPPAAEEFVMLLRSDLLRRYPNAVIYLAPAVQAGAGASDPTALVPDGRPEMEKAPIFGGFLPPDVVFFGFPVATDAATGADGTNGYYLIIQEHPTEPRFGVDDAFKASSSHLAISAKPPEGLDLQGGEWNTHAAQMALITRRRPVRLAIHVARLIAPA